MSTTTEPTFAEATTAVVIGGGRGIGRAVVADLARNGADVVFGYSSSQAAAEELQREVAAFGGRADPMQLDVTDEAAIQTFFRGLRRERGRIDILVNCAGITKDGFVPSMSRRKFEDVMTVNMTGTFLTCREALKVMADQRRGSIVNIASAAFDRGVAGQSNYCASKGAVVSFTRSLAMEAAPYGVRVNVIAPGYVDTDMTRGLGRRTARAIPLGRFGVVDEIASVVTFVVSDRASYMTGSIVAVDGGIGN